MQVRSCVRWLRVAYVVPDGLDPARLDVDRLEIHRFSEFLPSAKDHFRCAFGDAVTATGVIGGNTLVATFGPPPEEQSHEDRARFEAFLERAFAASVTGARSLDDAMRIVFS